MGARRGRVVARTCAGKRSIDVGRDRRPWRRRRAPGRRRGAGRRRARCRRGDPLHRHPARRRRRWRGGCSRSRRLRRRHARAEGEPILPDQDPERDLKDFSVYVFNSAQSTWERTFEQQGRTYDRAKLVLYRDGVDTGCGSASLGGRPVLLPRRPARLPRPLLLPRHGAQLGARGDFAWAYVIAHEVGHHVQQQLGTSDEVAQIRQSDPDRANEASVRLELQADCYAGVWAHAVFDELEAGDVEEAITRVGGGRRRPPPEPGRSGGRPGLVHARLVGAAARLVRARASARRAGRLRHVLRRDRSEPESRSRALTPEGAGTFEGHALLRPLRHRARPLRDRVG